MRPTLFTAPFSAGYIFPAGFRAQTLFRSSVDLDSLTLHTCEILGESGQYWPAPTFVVTSADRPDEPLVAKSCTGCWTAVRNPAHHAGRDSMDLRVTRDAVI